MCFFKKYEDIISFAYKNVPYSEDGIKICPYCNLILKQKINGDFYCISKRCSEKTHNFSNPVPKIEIFNEEILTLRDNVAYSIYYFGRLEQEIKNLLDKLKIKYKLWLNHDTYDFEFIIENEKWAIDAKDVENPRYVVRDINYMSNLQNSGDEGYTRIFYVVPNRRKKKGYLDVINRNIRNPKYKCITLKQL